MSKDNLIEKMLPAIENQLKIVVARSCENDDNTRGLHDMMTYQMGWSGEGAGLAARGKRIRPLLVLLTTAASGGEWEIALPAAAAVELIHNFSLIHDDIEDQSFTRRGRPTLWTTHGIAQAINTGDAMFTLAHLSMLDLEAFLPSSIVLDTIGILQRTCLELTKGQYLDISYENRVDLSLADYWPMIDGKTAALLGACTKIGSKIAGAESQTSEHYFTFGISLGKAFQVQDDILGIWGDVAKTGKSSASDLITGKKSLPVLYGLERGDAFAKRWLQGPISAAKVYEIATQLEVEGGKSFAQEAAFKLTNQALNALEAAKPRGEAGGMLLSLSEQLLGRQS